MYRFVVVVFVLYFGLILIGYSNTSSVQADRFKQAVEATVLAHPTLERPVVQVTKVVAVLPPEPPKMAELAGSLVPAEDESETVASHRVPSDSSASKLLIEEAVPQIAIGQAEQGVLALINAERAQNGLAALQLSPELVNAAGRHSNDMATHNLTVHTGSDGSTFQARISESGYAGAAVNEALFYGSPTPADSVNWWLNDEHHRPILLSDAYSEIGIGYVNAPSSVNRHYWTLTFGKPSGVGGPSKPNGSIPGVTRSDGSPQLTVSEEYVNVRRGPATNYAALGMAEGGERYDIIGRSRDGSWWQICCFEGEEAWIIGRYIAATGALDQVATVSVAPAFLAAVQPAIPATVPLASEGNVGDVATQNWPFELELTAQHLETNTATIYGYVHQNNNSLDGYFLRVAKNSVVMNNEARSSALALGTTKPATPDSPENKMYNMKMDFNTMSHPGFNPAGNWTIQLVNGAGEAVGPPATFTIAPNSTQMEMYVRYQK